MNFPFELFLSGLTLGIGPCSLFCIPILIPYIAGTRKGLLDGLKATLTFSLSRLAAYVLMGLTAGYSSELLTNLFSRTEFGIYIWIMGGIFISLLGALILIGEEPSITPCRLLRSYTLNQSIKSMSLLGFIVGVTPCAPLIGILTYITLSAKSPVLGAFYTFCFGLGASIITPITLIGILAGIAPQIIFKNSKILNIFKKTCGLLLFLLGVKLIISSLLGNPQY